jgi:hypothetical protein
MSQFHWVFWGLFFIPIASYSTCLIIAYIKLPPARFLLMPSSVVLVAPCPYIHGFSSAAVALLLLLVAYRSYQFLSRPRKGLRRAIASPLLVFACPVLAVAAGCLYAWMSLWTVSQSFLGHFVVHIGAFGLMLIYFIAMDVSLSALKQATPTWLAVYDIVSGLFVLAYTALMVLVRREYFPSSVYVMGAIGFVVIALITARFPIHGWQIMGQNFVVPFAAKRKKR